MSKTKWCAFDIETRDKAPEDPAASYALGVTCVGIAVSDPGMPPVSFRGMGSTMTPVEVCGIAHELWAYGQSGYHIASVNGLGFDFRVLAAECQDLAIFDNLKELALAHRDPAFQMLCRHGFMVGLDALAVGLELAERKTGDMDGVKATELWASAISEDQQKVLRYVEQDALVTLGIMQALESKRWTWHDSWERADYRDTPAMRWLTKKGKIAHKALPDGLLTVRECLDLPLPKTDWMDDPWPRSKFVGWLDE